MFPSHVELMEAKRQGRHATGKVANSPTQSPRIAVARPSEDVPRARTRRSRSRTTDCTPSTWQISSTATSPILGSIVLPDSLMPIKTNRTQGVRQPGTTSGTSDASPLHDSHDVASNRTSGGKIEPSLFPQHTRSHWELAEENDFGTFGPVTHKYSPVQAKLALPTEQDIAKSNASRRNEDQGRQSAAKIDQQHNLCKASREAAIAKREHDLANQTTRINGTVAVLRSVRRGMSDGVLAATSTMPTRASTRSSPLSSPYASAEHSPQRSPLRSLFNLRAATESPTALSVADSEDAYFDAQSYITRTNSPSITKVERDPFQSQEDQNADGDDVGSDTALSSVHGETSALQLAVPASAAMSQSESWQSSSHRLLHGKASFLPQPQEDHEEDASDSHSSPSAASSTASLGSPISPLTPEDRLSGAAACMLGLEPQSSAREGGRGQLPKLLSKPSRKSLGSLWSSSKGHLPLPNDITETQEALPKADWIPSSRPVPTLAGPRPSLQLQRPFAQSRPASMAVAADHSPTSSSSEHGMRPPPQRSPQMRSSPVLPSEAYGQGSFRRQSYGQINMPTSPFMAPTERAACVSPQPRPSLSQDHVRPSIQPRKNTNPFRRFEGDQALVSDSPTDSAYRSHPSATQQPHGTMPRMQSASTSPYAANTHLLHNPWQTQQHSPLPPAPLPLQYPNGLGRRATPSAELASLNPYHPAYSQRHASPPPFLSDARRKASMPVSPPTETPLGAWAEMYFQRPTAAGEDGARVQATF